MESNKDENEKYKSSSAIFDSIVLGTNVINVNTKKGKMSLNTFVLKK